MKILYTVIDGEISGGNMVCLRIIEEALRRGYKPVINSPTAGKFTNILREKGLKVYNIDTRSLYHLDSTIKLVSIIKKENIDLLDSHAPLSGTVLSRVAARFAGIPIVNHEHGLAPLNPHPFIKRYQLWANAVTAKIGSCRIIAVSQATKRGLIQRGIPSSQIDVVYNGILEENGQTKCPELRGRILKELGLSSSSLIVGQVGRIDEKKGQHLLIRAAVTVLKKFPEVYFLIVGEDFRNGLYQRQLETLAKELGVSNRFIFTGYRSDIEDIMSIFDLFVLPSSAEGLPLVVLEAMAKKRPVITTAVGGNTEIVEDGQTGSVILPDDPAKLAEAIIYHLAHPDVSRRMGENGYKMVGQKFSLSGMLNRTMGIYKQLVKD